MYRSNSTGRDLLYATFRTVANALHSDFTPDRVVYDLRTEAWTSSASIVMPDMAE